MTRARMLLATALVAGGYLRVAADLADRGKPQRRTEVVKPPPTLAETINANRKPSRQERRWAERRGARTE
jgi:hypothetical protein